MILSQSSSKCFASMTVGSVGYHNSRGVVGVRGSVTKETRKAWLETRGWGYLWKRSHKKAVVSNFSARPARTLARDSITDSASNAGVGRRRRCPAFGESFE